MSDKASADILNRRIFLSVAGLAGAGVAIRTCTAIVQPCCGLGRRAARHKCAASPAGAAAVSTTTVGRAVPGPFSLMR